MNAVAKKRERYVTVGETVECMRAQGVHAIRSQPNAVRVRVMVRVATSGVCCAMCCQN